MNIVEIELTERQDALLNEVARRLKRSREDLLQDAVKQLIASFEQETRADTMRRARGIWSARQLPNMAIRTDRVLKGRTALPSEEKT